MPSCLYYILDPMCSWCWGFKENFARLENTLASIPALHDLNTRFVLGGLATDSDEPMEAQMRTYIQDQWRQVHTATGAEFNWDFWEKCQPRRSTYPACRAMIAAELQQAGANRKMLGAIQSAYYMQARNPSDDSTLIELAQEIGLDVALFKQDLRSDHVESKLHEDFRLRKQLGVRFFPTVMLEKSAEFFTLLEGNQSWQEIENNISRAIDES